MLQNSQILFIFTPISRIVATVDDSTMRNVALVIATIALVTTILEVSLGAFPVSLFAAPLNLLVMLLWALAVLYLYRSRATSPVSRFLMGREATWLSLVAMAVVGVVLGLQRDPASDSWAVVVALLFILTHLALVILRGWRGAQGIRWRFVLLHVGLLVALGAGFWGAPDREQLRLSVGSEPESVAYTMSGAERRLPYDISLEEFNLEVAQSGVPTNYEATVGIDGRSVVLRVNHPYSRTLAEKIYLVSHGTSPRGSEYVVLEVVREPWQWLSAVGIVMLIVGAVLLFVRGPKGGVDYE